MQVGEIQPDETLLHAALSQGVQNLSLDQSVTFQEYLRVVLPVDGFVFWKPTGKAIKPRGSLHYAQELHQDEEQTAALANTLFTTTKEIKNFARTLTGGARYLYVATVNGFRFAVSQQQGFYSQAGLWHYFGRSIWPALYSQLLDPGRSVDTTRAVVSNSLPFWLQIADWAPDWLPYGKSPPLFPAFLAPANEPPPYGTVEITPTRALQPVPTRGGLGGAHSQLVADTVRLTLYGLQNNEAVDFLDAVIDYSAATDNIGLMNAPTIVDDPRPQEEIQALAMRKRIEFDVSYYQSRSLDLAYQMIREADCETILGTLAT